MSIEKNDKPVGSFRDKAVAHRALETYMHEIKGVGLRWMFDRRPDQMDTFLSRHYSSPAEHFREIDGFVDQVRSFGGFVTDLETFVARLITQASSLARRKPPYNVPDMSTRAVSREEVAAYNRFYSSLVDYTGVLINHGPNSPEVAEAATSVAQNIRPDEWRKAGVPISEGATSCLNYGTRQYLEDVMNAPPA